MIIINRKKALTTLITFLMLILFFILLQRYYYHLHTVKLVMGGILYHQETDDDDNRKTNKNNDVETYFRPSSLPVLNNRFTYRLIDSYFGKKVSEISLPDYLLKTPEDTMINYYSTLREAANPEPDKLLGCGTIGQARIPYPVAYHFLSSSYQKKLPYQQYLNTFKNILHISLIKYKEVPVYENTSGTIRYFVELETIRGSKDSIA